jgi:protein-S-isoprenylcysteine O-methyltransferase Ste14
MKVPSLPHLILLFFLGGMFLHFMLAGGRTFYWVDPEKEPGLLVGQCAFMFGGVLPIWLLGLYQPIHRVSGIVSAGILAVSLALYEWARHTIWRRRFGVGWGEHVPEELCESGPYRFVRHPIYLAYLLAWLAALVALPHWLTAALLVAMIALFTHAAFTDEAKIGESPIATGYAEYRRRAGMFWPRFSSAGPDRQTP